MARNACFEPQRHWRDRLRSSSICRVQGNTVLIPPWVIGAMIGAMLSDPSVEIATPAVRMDRRSYEALRAAKQAGEVGGTTVAFDRCHNAL